jgi:hypothetical protein
LEHVLPQKEDAWPDFDLAGRAREDWVYSLGNMSLLEQALNKSLQASEFSAKVSRYRQRDVQNPDGSALPMTYRIAKEYDTHDRLWEHNWITERCEIFAQGASAVWPLPISTQSTLESNGGISSVESEDGMI